jgi:hypothetical protein
MFSMPDGMEVLNFSLISNIKCFLRILTKKALQLLVKTLSFIPHRRKNKYCFLRVQLYRLFMLSWKFVLSYDACSHNGANFGGRYDGGGRQKERIERRLKAHFGTKKRFWNKNCLPCSR